MNYKMYGAICPHEGHKQHYICSEGQLIHLGGCRLTVGGFGIFQSGLRDWNRAAVFMPPPPSYMAPCLPAEGSKAIKLNNSGVTLTNGPSDATEPRDNPSGLDGHPAERPLMAAVNQADDRKYSADF